MNFPRGVATIKCSIRLHLDYMALDKKEKPKHTYSWGNNEYWNNEFLLNNGRMSISSKNVPFLIICHLHNFKESYWKRKKSYYANWQDAYLNTQLICLLLFWLRGQVFPLKYAFNFFEKTTKEMEQSFIELNCSSTYQYLVILLAQVINLIVKQNLSDICLSWITYSWENTQHLNHTHFSWYIQIIVLNPLESN